MLYIFCQGLQVTGGPPIPPSLCANRANIRMHAACDLRVSERVPLMDLVTKNIRHFPAHSHETSDIMGNSHTCTFLRDGLSVEDREEASLNLCACAQTPVIFWLLSVLIRDNPHMTSKLGE